jgi:hypothetical protein
VLPTAPGTAEYTMYLPPLLEALGLAEVTHHPRDNSLRASSQTVRMRRPPAMG